MPEFSATLGIAEEIRVPLNGDHSTIVKYSSEEDNNYRVVSKTLAGLVQAARNKAQLKTKIPQSPSLLRRSLLSRGSIDHATEPLTDPFCEAAIELQRRGDLMVTRDLADEDEWGILRCKYCAMRISDASFDIKTGFLFSKWYFGSGAFLFKSHLGKAGNGGWAYLKCSICKDPSVYSHMDQLVSHLKKDHTNKSLKNDPCIFG